MELTDMSRAAGSLLVKALNPRLAPKEDKAYSELLGQYRNNPAFAKLTQEVAQGMGLRILETGAGESGLIVVPLDSASAFAFRMGDLRSMDEGTRHAFVLICAVIAKLFYPTEDALYADSNELLPVTVSDMLAEATRYAHAYPGDDPTDATPHGWRVLAGFPERLPGEQRANVRSLVGLIRTALRYMDDYGLVRAYGRSTGDSAESYYATRRFQAQLRECALPEWFRIVREAQVSSPLSAELSA